MRSHNLRIAVFTILLTGYTYGQNPPTLLTLEEGATLRTVVLTFTNDVEKCYLETPSGLKVEFKPNNEANDKYELLPDTDVTRCHANVNNIDMNDSGLWTLSSELSTGSILSQSYNVTVAKTTDNTAVDDDDSDAPIVEELEGQYFDTKIGANHTVFIRDYAFVTSERCVLMSPSDKLYRLEQEIPEGIEVINRPDATCAIRVTINSEDVVGNWALYAEGSRFSDNVIRRLPFTIHVEEFVEASVSEIIVVEGNDFYARLKNSIPNYDTCRLLGPDGNEYNDFEKDSRFVENCGFIVRHLQTTQSGTWYIVYGNKIVYRAPISVAVNVATVGGETNFVWSKDRPVSVFVGPEDAVYCSLTGPDGSTYYDGFGRCKVDIDRASKAHQGLWKLTIGLPGQVLTRNSEIFVMVVEADPKPLVLTQVTANKPNVTLSCNVTSPYPVRSCKFRDPSGRVLLANEGVGESRYTFHGAGSSYTSDLHTHDCGIMITDPLTRDLGLWRCAVETEEETYYGFLGVFCPWAMRDPEVAAAVITDPTLTADRPVVNNVVGDSVTLTCSVQSAIRYCYFRAQNGTVFNVGPTDSHDQATYVGAGFDAGECGIRFPSLSVSDTGNWSCHVGLQNVHAAEQRARIEVYVHDAMTANQKIDGNLLIVEAQVYNGRILDYCRFVRIDGLGFTTNTIPERYTDLSIPKVGHCGIAIKEPTILENHPWTVVARIRGQDVELSRVTPITLASPSPPPVGGVTYYRLPVAWIVVMAVGLVMVVVASLLGPKNNRHWAYARASTIRNSFMRKTVEQQRSQTTKVTATAA
ncbi:uncharacterized protein LOC124538758 [Vanessa cardui]|uniref:uncharacterized protein LOC124538758 n=1 Tax=Vanessa cardui TaxID=171605 RepID=UPI001F13544B|nr:uncharacterized protein LOC124538758 [Vanessa cardui]